MKTKPLVYLAGPFTSHPTHNTKNMADWWDTLQWNLYKDKATFICPHWSALQDMINPRTWEAWLKYDKELIDSCDAVIRIAGDSKGADEEVAYAEKLGIPVFHQSIHVLSIWDRELQQWIANWKPKASVVPVVVRPPKPKRMVVGFMGHPGRGKTTLANMVRVELHKDQHWSVVNRSFAEPIKNALAVMGIKKQGTDDPAYRAMATGLSTIRDYNPNFYVEIMKAHNAKDMEAWKDSRNNLVVLIDDVRYENETALCDYIFLLDSWDMPNPKKWAEKGVHKSEQYCHDLLEGRISLKVPSEFLSITYGEEHLKTNAEYIADRIRKDYVGRLYQ